MISVSKHARITQQVRPGVIPEHEAKEEKKNNDAIWKENCANKRAYCCLNVLHFCLKQLSRWAFSFAFIKNKWEKVVRKEQPEHVGRELKEKREERKKMQWLHNLNIDRPVFFLQSLLSERFEFNWFLFTQIHCWNASNEKGHGEVNGTQRCGEERDQTEQDRTDRQMDKQAGDVDIDLLYTCYINAWDCISLVSFSLLKM